MPHPRVTIGIATYRRDTYLAAAIDSCLQQTFADREVLLVVDGPGTPAIDAIIAAREGIPGFRVVRHGHNRGISAAYTTLANEARGELIAMLGDDDVAMPDRLERQVAVFDAHPDTGVVLGNARIIDEHDATVGMWTSRDRAPGALLRHLVREHNTLVDPTRMVHRRVHEAVGGYDPEFTLAQDFEFWLRAMMVCRFRHVDGEPLIALRRHGDNFSDESARALEVAQVEAALGAFIHRTPLPVLVPELDWPVLDPAAGRRTALRVLAAAMDTRGLPLPNLAARLRGEAAEVQVAPPAPATKGKLLMTSFGFNDSGGGTTIPRLAAKELARRGWDVTVFHAATAVLPDEPPYTVREWDEDGVHLVGVHNREHWLWDLGNPLRELDDPPITRAFARLVDRLRPDVAHVHNLHNMGAALLDVLSAHGVPTYFTTHNYWLVCPRAYLFHHDLSLCDGPAHGGSACAACVGSPALAAHADRLAGIRDRFTRSITACMTVSHAVRRTLLAQGYPADRLDVVHQCVPAQDEAWERVGRHRSPGRVDPDRLVVGFFGSVYPHKGAHLLVEAAQRTTHPVRVRIHGEIGDDLRAMLAAADTRGVVEFCGAFSPSELPDLLAGVDAAALPSVWWDCAPLTAGECLAARVPVLAPRMGGLAEAITDGVDGLAFDGGDAAGLAAAIDRLAGEPGLLERLQAGITPPRGFAAWVDELERYYAGERTGRVEGLGRGPLAVLWAGRPEAAARLRTEPGIVVQTLARDGGRDGAPLPHPPDVQVHSQWPPAAPVGSGRVVLAPPADLQDDAELVPRATQSRIDEVWVTTPEAAECWAQAGFPPERVRVAPRPDAAGWAGWVLARLRVLAQRSPRMCAPTPRPITVEGPSPRTLAAPAWLGDPAHLAGMLRDWSAQGEGTLVLLADPAVDGGEQEIVRRITEAAATAHVDLDACGDIELHMEPGVPGRDEALHAACDDYLDTPGAAPGHRRRAKEQR